MAGPEKGHAARLQAACPLWRRGRLILMRAEAGLMPNLVPYLMRA
jgi:hypothetical protein